MNKDENVNELLYETLQATLESGKRMGYAQGRDETAREILQMIYDKGKDIGLICLPTSAIKQLAKAYYGIELEDNYEGRSV